MDPFTDPESLRNRATVPFQEETQRLSREFESIADSVDSHAVVGITNDEGEVLLMNDGSHGWTLVAAPVDSGEDWTAIARQRAETLLDTTVALEEVELVRRIDFCAENDPERRTSMYNVVFTASVDGDVSIEDIDSRVDDLSLEWFAGVPEGQDGGVADDIRLFTESS